MELEIQPTYNFQYCANSLDDEPILYIDEHVGVDPDGGNCIIGSQFAKEITILDSMGKSKIHICFNSYGGIVKDGWSIVTSILRCKTKTCGYIGGVAASIAGVAFQACDERTVYPFSLFMAHNPSFNEDSNENDPVLEIHKESLLIILSMHPKMSRGKMDDIMDAETWILGDDIVKYGFADECLKLAEISEQINPEYIINNKITFDKKSVLDLINKYKLISNKITDTIKNNKNKMADIKDLKKVLNLPETATDIEILNAVEALKVAPKKIKNKGGNSQTDKDNDEDETMYDSTKDDCYNESAETFVHNDDDDSKEIMDNDDDIMNIKAENKKLKDEMKNLKNSIKIEKAKALITNYVKIGKLKNEQKLIEKWTNMAIADYDLAKDLIDDFPVNKSASKIKTVDNVSQGNLLDSNKYDAVALKMQEIQNKFKLK